MNVAVFGGTGFIGQYVVKELIERGHKPVLLVRPGSGHKVPLPDRCETVTGYMSDIKDIETVLHGCNAAVYLAGIIREFPRKAVTFEELHFLAAVRVMERADALGVNRFLLMSANGVKPDGTLYQRTKYRAEIHLRSSKLSWTIFRPSIVFGDPCGCMDFCTMIRDQIVHPPFPAPLFYTGIFPKSAGTFRLSPVHVSDVASCFGHAIDNDDCFGKILPLCGTRDIEWREIISIIAHVTGKRKVMAPVPSGPVIAAAQLFKKCPWFPVTPDQITMLLEGNTCDSRAVFQRFGIDPVPFNAETLEYLRAK